MSTWQTLHQVGGDGDKCIRGILRPASTEWMGPERLQPWYRDCPNCASWTVLPRGQVVNSGLTRGSMGDGIMWRSGAWCIAWRGKEQGEESRQGGDGREARSGSLTADNKRDLILSLIFQALLFIFSHTVIFFFFLLLVVFWVFVGLWFLCGVLLEFFLYLSFLFWLFSRLYLFSIF